MNDAVGEWLTVAEAAHLLNVPARRIRHVLERSAKQGENAPETRQKVTRTKTGERTATAYPRLWLVALLENDTHENVPQPSAETRQEPYAERSAPEPTERSEDWRARALVAEALLVELRDRVAKADDALKREQANAAAALAQSRGADQRLAAVLAATGRLQVEAPKTADATAPDPGQGDTQPAREGEGQPLGRTESRGGSWWARLWGRE